MKDFFICHASEDKKNYVYPISEGLNKNDIKTWIDEGEIDYGDNIILKIQEGINNSKFALIVISQIWLKKNWPLHELSNLLYREIRKGETKVIPLVIGDMNMVLDKLPLLEAKYCMEFKSIEESINELTDFINRKKSNSGIKKLNDFNDLFMHIEEVSKLENENKEINFEDYSEVFRNIIKVDNTVIPESNVFNYITSIIQNSDSKYPLSVLGYPGTGKTKFLILFYRYLKMLFLNKSISKVPVYLNLNNYDQFEQIKSLELFNRDFKILNHFFSAHTNDFIFIIDGFNDYFKRTNDNDIKLVELLDKYSHVRIVGSNISDGKYIKSTKSRYIPNSEFEVTISSIDKSNIHFSDFVTAYTKTKCCATKVEETVKSIHEIIETFSISAIDLFTISLLLKKITNRAYSHCSNLTDLIEEYIINQKSSNKNPNTIDELSELAFCVFMEDKSNSFDSENLNPLLHNNFVVRDFLLANYVIKNLLNKKRKDIYNKVFPYEVNKFCKLLMNVNQTTEKEIYSSIIELLNENTPIHLNTKTHFCYLLGRIKNDRLATKAIKTLLSIKEKYNAKNDFSKETLLLLRTIYISLIFLGEKDGSYTEFSNEYLTKLLKSEIWNNLNRGFHLEYYGDIPINPNEPDLLKHEDDLRDCDMTFNRLYTKISDCLNGISEKYTLFELEVFTLCSLIQQRSFYPEIKLNNDLYEKYILVINRVLENQSIHISPLLDQYLNMLKTNISHKITSQIQFAYDLFHIKSNVRTGWMKEGISIDRPESIADHTMGAVILAKLFLPDIIPEEPKYDKNKVIDILLFHDIAEAYTTDIPKFKKSPKHKELEKDAISYISMISSYDKIGNLIDIMENWSTLESYSENDYNYKIAKEIDKLENLLQLYIYNDKNQFSEEAFNEFNTDLIKNINTKKGLEILNIIKSYNENKIEHLGCFELIDK